MMHRIKETLGRLCDHLLRPFAPAVAAGACTNSSIWCCDAAGDCGGTLCWDEYCCNSAGRQIWRPCAENAGAGNVSCGQWRFTGTQC
jgi:hypothetical protein